MKPAIESPIPSDEKARGASVEVRPGDWNQWGGSPQRANVHADRGIPTTWKLDLETETPRPVHVPFVPAGSENVRWAIDIGSQIYATPAVANGRIFVGTNNGAAFLKRFPKDVDLGVLLCLDEGTGRFLWQYSSPKLQTGRVNDWPEQGIPSTPYCDGDRVWIATNRCTIVCLDAEGFRDGENDGPFRDEAVAAENEADVVWELDMIRDLGVFPHNLTISSPTCIDGVLFVNTCNGVGEDHQAIPAPLAPNFLAINRETGQVLWQDATPGARVLHGGWASPSYGVFDGQPQIVFPGGDGWLYAFDPKGDGDGGSKLLWRFDCNPKESKWLLGSPDTRNSCIGFAAIDDGRVYYAVGQDPEHGNGVGHLWCIDPTRRGDVSPELVVDGEGQQIERPNEVNRGGIREGQRVVANPNSSAVWHYGGLDEDGSVTGRKGDLIFRRSLSTPAIEDGVLYVADLAGWVHCLDARTGRRHWEADTFGSIWGSVAIIGDHVYLGDADGDVHVLRHSADHRIAHPNARLQREYKLETPLSANRIVLDKANEMPNAIYSTPIVANGVLYLTDRGTLYAIAAPKEGDGAR